MNTSVSHSSIIHVHIPCGRVTIPGELAIPAEAKGLVIFSHATKGGWTDSKNWTVAWKLHQGGYATLLLDLLTPVEAGLETAKGFLGFEVPLLAERLIAATRWAKEREELRDLAVAYFGSDAGAAAAIEAAAALPAVSAIVGRAARTELVSDEAKRVKTPMLLIVGENDRRARRRNREFSAHSRLTRRLGIVKGASHVFREKGAQCQVADLTVSWFKEHLRDERMTPEELRACPQ